MSDLSAAWTRARGALSQRFQQQGQALCWTRVREALTLRSLSARSFTATVCGLVLIQLVSFGLAHYAEERQTRTRMLAFMSADISPGYEVMDGTPQQERLRWIGWLNRGFYQISLGKADEHQVEASLGQLLALDVVAQRASQQLRRADIRWVWRGDAPILILPLDDGDALQVRRRPAAVAFAAVAGG